MLKAGQDRSSAAANAHEGMSDRGASKAPELGVEHWAVPGICGVLLRGTRASLAKREARSSLYPKKPWA
jgi:hypothetical protein